MWGRGERVGWLPVGHGRTCWFATADAPAGRTSPDLGQGAAQALEDAVALAASLQSTSVPDGLARYDTARRPRTQRIAARARRVGRVAQMSGARGAVRDTVVRAVPSVMTRRALDPILRGVV